MPSFDDFQLQPATRAVLTTMEITQPTPIQLGAIPVLLAGKDLVGQSATGSGKTLAYGLPLVERLARDKRVVQALVLVPTRELAIQVHAVLGKLASSRRLSMALLVGGRPYGSQIAALRYGAQIVIGTPGRVKDHLDRGTLVLNQLRICVLDEADQMLDSGFAPVVEEILTTTPDTRQMAFFSATMPDWVEKLQKKFLKNPVTIAIAPASDVENTIEQIAYQVPNDQKIAALCTLLHSTQGESSLIFGRTKHGVEKLGKQLNKLGFTVGTLHGNKSQRAREEVLTAFRRGHVQTLLATNIAARGLDITGIYQVINYELPESSELFTHRIGRTGRMGRQGKAITLLAPSDVPTWRRMTRSLGQPVALQRLALNEEASETQLLARVEASRTQEHKQDDEQQPEHDREQVISPAQERGRPARRQQDSQATPDRRDRQRERVPAGTATRRPAWRREDAPSRERSSFDRERDGRRGVGRPSSVAGTRVKHKAPAFETAEPEYSARRKPRTTATRPQRGNAPNRSASR
ncbi:MAG: DEAD/DEAH box helicase [Chloroflexota bacterium]|nr:DEAD/DEAH box helicase [Chloroflexota bacterium]